MSDNITTTPEIDEPAATEPTTTEPTTNQRPARAPRRIVKISGATLVLAPAYDGATIDQIKQHLAQTGYPEAANASHTTGVNDTGDEIISFLPVAGRKG